MSKRVVSKDEELDELKKTQQNKKLKSESSDDQIIKTTTTLDISSSSIPNDHIIIARGFICYIFDPKTFKFHRTVDTIRDRSYFEMLNVNNKVYAISTFSVIASGTVECYDIELKKWTSNTSLSKKLRSIGSSTLNNSLIITGGIDLDTLERSNNVYEGVITDDTINWNLKTSKLSTPRYRHAAITTPDGKVWVAGGIVTNSSNNESFSSSTEIYDSTTDTWSDGPSMLTARAIDIHLLLVNKQDLYVVGGDVISPTFDYEGGPLKGTIEYFDRKKNQWIFITQFPTERRGVSACVVGNVIYVFGGSSGDVDLLTWDAFDLEKSIWLSSDGETRAMPFDCTYGRCCVVTV